MAGAFIAKRVRFAHNGDQADFIMNCKRALDCSWSELADKLRVSPRTLRDWVREKFNISEKSFTCLCNMAKLPDVPKVKFVDLTDHLARISRSGGEAQMNKYGFVGGNKKYRKMRWQQWWDSIGKDIPSPRLKYIMLPSVSEDLAEFIGIMLGDGGLAPYHISVTLNSIDEKEYAKFVSDLIFRLFGVIPKRYLRKNSNAVDITVQRKHLVDFCLSLGLKIGNKVKNKSNIPIWILAKRDLTISCLRGLFDTDGSVFIHSYESKGKLYSYPKINFSNESCDLIMSVYEILNKFGFCVRMDEKRRNAINIDNQPDVKRFMKLIGSNNPKHWQAYRKIWRRA